MTLLAGIIPGRILLKGDFEMSKGYAIVTGASRGMGKAIFLELAKEGYDLLGVYTSKGSASKMQDLIGQVTKENGVKAFSFQADVGKADDCKALVDYAQKTLGRDISVLINNAGIDSVCSFKDENLESIAHTVNVDLMGPMNLCCLVLPYMIERKGGDIINMSSSAPLMGLAGDCSYNAAKYGLVGFSKTLAKEVGQYNIKVNCIAPGVMNTSMTANAAPAEQTDLIVKTIPMGCMGDPEEIPLCVSYILKSAYLTGQTIAINGGLVSIP